MRIGFGYDVHKLVEGRKFILGGVDVEFEKGPMGHSDADVLVHAIIDALIGACAMGDIGRLFPDSEKEYKDISSMILLETVRNVLRQEKYKIINIDSSIVVEKPKLSEYIPKMTENIAKILEIDYNQVSVKATTTEGLGFTGTGKGIAAYAVVSVEKE